MTWGDLERGDVLYKEPIGKFPLWLLLRVVGPRLAVYMNLETGEEQEASRDSQQLLDEGWVALRDGELRR